MSKFRVKKLTPENTRFFAPLPVSAWPKLLLQFHFKNQENVWTDLKTAPQYNSNPLNCKKHRNISPLSLQLRSYNQTKKLKETVTINVKMPIVNKKPLARKRIRIFVQTPFSHYLYIRVKNFTPQNHSLHLPFQRDQNYFNLHFKIIKMCEQILQKTASQYNSNSLNGKKQDRKNCLVRRWWRPLLKIETQINKTARNLTWELDK